MQKSHPSPHEHILHEKGGSGRIRAQHCHLGGQEASWGRSAGRLQHSAMVKARLRTQAIIAVQLLSLAWLFVTPWTAARQASLSFPISWSLLKLMSIELVVPDNHLVLCYLLLLLPSIFPSIRVFSNESVLRIRWPMYWSFSFSISPSNEYSVLISLGWTGWNSFQSKGLSRVFCNTTVQKHQFFSTQLSV